MTAFEKSKFITEGEYVHYQGKFIARFKHVKGNKAGFLKFLAAHFTVEEYFAARALEHAPATILEAKGYVPAHIAKWLKEGKLAAWTPRIADLTKHARAQ